MLPTKLKSVVLIGLLLYFVLQDFFVADGEGLPRSTVERDSKFAHQVLSLFSLQVCGCY